MISVLPIRIMVRIFLISILLLDGNTHVVRSCDPSTKVIPREGNIGQAAEFSWLGILRVHLHYEREFKVAITGIVLVKVGYAIVNAHDVVRVPKRTFKEDSEAMFIAVDQKPWRCRLKDYFAHPEYDYSTVNTLAVLELLPWEDDYYPMVPICWPPREYNSTDNLYAVGYTDENMLLEKTIYRLQSVSQEKCQEFYHRAGLSEGLAAPLYYRCGVAVSNNNNCVWDNGMVLVTNTTGYWSLLGLSVLGPGCAAPARFLELQAYLPWVLSLTNIQELDARRRPEPWRKHNIHELFLTNATAVHPPFGEDHDRYYPFLTPDEDPMEFDIKRINQSAIVIHKLEDPVYYGTPVQYGECPQHHPLVYRDDVSVNYSFSPKYFVNNTMVYKIGLYDLSYMNYSCTILTVKSGYKEQAYLYFKTELEARHAHMHAPADLLQHYPPPGHRRGRPAPRPQMRPNTISALWGTIRNVTNVNVYVRIQFVNEARLELYVYGQRRRRYRTQRRKLRSTTRTTTSDPYANRRAAHDATHKLRLNARVQPALASHNQFLNTFDNSNNCGCIRYFSCLFVVFIVMVL